MRIHQAVFGPLKGHSFLKGSDDSLEELFRNAAWATDLPQTVPPRVTWTEFFRLMQLDEQLVLIYTKPLEHASRAGMVLSRAAFIPLTMVEKLADLRPIAHVLQTVWVEGDTLLPITPSVLQTAAQIEDPTTLSIQIAAALNRSGKKPLVVIGQEGFDEAMLNLWSRVPPEFRCQLTFGLSFGQDDVRNLNIVCTPQELVSKWSSAHHVSRLVQAGIDIDPHTSTLLDFPVSDSARSFASELQLSLNSSMAISIALKARHLWKHGVGPADAINLMRILTERSKSVPITNPIKLAVIERLVSTASDWTGQDVLSMRNLEPVAMPNVDTVSGVLINWARSLPSRATSSDIDSIVDSWVTADATLFWCFAIGAGLESAFANEAVADSLLIALWHTLEKRPEHTRQVLSLLASAKDAEKRLLMVIPRSIAVIFADRLLPVFVSQGWWELTGILLARSRPTADALNVALNIESKNFKKVFLASTLSEASDGEVVATAISSQDAVAIQIAGDACIRTPDIFKAFDWRNPIWFQILGDATSKSSTIVKAILNTDAGMGLTIDAQLADDFVWRVIAKTGLSDLINVPGRERAWSLIPDIYLSEISTTTAKSWLSLFEMGSVLLNQLESQLATVVKTIVSTRGYLIQVLQRAPASLALYFRDFISKSEVDAQSFLTDLMQSMCMLNESNAQMMGRIIRDNHWTNTAQFVMQQTHRRSDFRPIMKECINLLGLVERLRVGWQLGVPIQLSQDEAWNAFESEAITLYPQGPSDRALWSRSGGLDEDLARESTGRTSWHRCIRELRNGMPPSVQELLNLMIEDFSSNNTLKHLLKQQFWK